MHIFMVYSSSQEAVVHLNLNTLLPKVLIMIPVYT